MPDRIIIEDLKVKVRIGVKPAEQRRPQEVWISVEIPKSLHRAARSDRLEDTVDYRAVSRAVDRVAKAHPRRLIECLAGDIGREVIKIFGVKTVKVFIKKFILPRTRYVAVQVTTVKKR